MCTLAAVEWRRSKKARSILVVLAKRRQRRAMYVIFAIFERPLHKYGKYLVREKNCCIKTPVYKVGLVQTPNTCYLQTSLSELLIKKPLSKNFGALLQKNFSDNPQFSSSNAMGYVDSVCLARLKSAAPFLYH